MRLRTIFLLLFAAGSDRVKAQNPALICLGIQIDRVFLLPGETQFATVATHNSGTATAHVPLIVSLF